MKNTLLIFLFFSLNACFMPHSQDPNNTSNFQYTNALINETSPYLLQHAHNPVNWMPWNEKSLQKAKEEDKPLLISIGYSACHWCHVMEHESFEDSTVADLMNKHFICIKVDREERPDVDQVYMNAVQLMTGRGGWPLNCFATPDGRPFYGGTYFQKEQWMSVLQQISNVYANERSKVEDYANQLTEGVKNSELIVKSSGNLPFSIDSLADGLSRWKSVFDTTFGGNDQAPKFPIPNNYQFLLNYYYHTKDEQLKAHLDLSLEKMAYGGIYDQIGGGFARYSTDMQWKVPHFEKMLYDNAQLLSLYAEAYRLNPKPLYERIIRETIGFIKEELYHEKGAFYSALDADSEGEEGKFYVWTKEELKNILADDFKVVEQLYNINSFGFWEKDNYVLIRNKSNAALSETLNLKESELEEKIKSINQRLKEHREKRMKPGLDDKSLTSWNALTIKGLVDSYLSLGETAFLDLALQNANFLLTVQHKKDGSLWHSYKDGKSTINGYLEDYSFTAEAFIALYEATLDEKWLRAARQLVEYCKVHFYDAKSGMFFFTSDEDPHLIARKTEVQDNVIPASNSTLAKVLFKLSLYFENPEYEQLSKQMLRNMLHQFDTYLPSYTNWGILLLNQAFPYYEIAVVGPNATDVILELHQHYLPNKLLIGSKKEQTSLALLENKWVHEQTTIYVCENKVCQLPVTAVSDALKQIKP